MMRVLYLTKTLQWHSINKVIFELAQHLAANGDEPHICALFEAPANDSPLRAQYRHVTTLRVRSPFDWRKARELTAYCRAHGIQLIHAHYPLAHFFGFAAARRLKIPLLFTSHDDDNWSLRPSRLLPSLFMYSTLPFTPCVVTVSHELQRHVKFKMTRRLVTIYNGVDLSAFESLPSHSEGEMRRMWTNGEALPVIGTVTRMFAKKGLDVLIAATRLVKERGQNLCTVIAGEGPLRADLQRLACEAGVAPQIKFLGYRKDIPEILRNLDLFVLPSLWEGHSIALLEAMAAAKAIIATNAGGNPEAIQEGVTGWLVPPNDPQSLADKILAVLAAPERGPIGCNARRFCRMNYSVETMTSNYQKLYRECMDNAYA